MLQLLVEEEREEVEKEGVSIDRSLGEGWCFHWPPLTVLTSSEWCRPVCVCLLKGSTQFSDGKMIFDSDSSDGGQVSCFCDSKEGTRKGVDGATLKREKEVIQLASVRNRAVCFRETSNYNRRQRKLANFLSLEKDSDGSERRSGDWIMCLSGAAAGSVKTYPWTTSARQKFELVPWRKQKRQLDIINFTAWEPDELTTPNDASGRGKARRYKQHPPPATHNQEIRRLIRLRMLFALELQRQKQLRALSGNKEEVEEEDGVEVEDNKEDTVQEENKGSEESVIRPRIFEKKSTESVGGSEKSVCDTSAYADPKALAANFVGYFGCADQESEGGGGGRMEQVDPLSASFSDEDWLVCCESFKCEDCKR